MHDQVIARAEMLEIPDHAVIATDAAGMVIYWDRGAQELYGWSAAEAIGRDILDLTPTDMSRTQAIQIMRSLKQGATWRGKFGVRGKYGELFIADVTDIPVHDSAGNLIGIIGRSRRDRRSKPR